MIVSTCQRPEHLRRSLLSLSLQRGVEQRFEVVVCEDGATDSTAEVVAKFAKTADFPVRLVNQEHRGFQAARCRNNGAMASRAPYLIFFDGDCVFPPDHLRQHIRARRPGYVRTGDSYRLEEEPTTRIDDVAIISGMFVECVSEQELRRMRRRWIKDSLYAALRHPTKPKVMAGNLAVWREDFERVNGFDEQFIGWGCEDDDLGQRLRQAGVRIAPIFGYTQAYHLWHPSHPSRPTRWREGANVEYLFRRDKPMRCSAGLSAHRCAAAADSEREAHPPSIKESAA